MMSLSFSLASVTDGGSAGLLNLNKDKVSGYYSASAYSYLRSRWCAPPFMRIATRLSDKL